jgi:hypothetical protein
MELALAPMASTALGDAAVFDRIDEIVDWHRELALRLRSLRVSSRALAI